jgi:uncharacterized protein YwqG
MDDLPSVQRELIERALPRGAAGRLIAKARPAVALLHGPATSTVVTRLGGRPLLEPDEEWPEYLDTPLSFLALVDLAELRDLTAGTGLPRSGLLNFFYETDEQAWGFDPADRGSWRVLAADPTTAELRVEPDGTPRFPEIPLAGRRIATLPGWEEDVSAQIMGTPDGRVDDRHVVLSEQLDAMAPAGPRHRLSGWPDLEQAPWQLECQLASHGLYVGTPEGYGDPRAVALKPGADDWVMLVQIDSDDDAGWMWGDVGKLYFAIRRQDLAAAAFDRTWMVLQCG